MKKVAFLLVFALVLINACKKEEADACKGVNCLNGGQCNDGTCVCPTGWTGEFCQTSTNSCDNVNCLNGGVCNTGTCTCPTGWTGQFCQTPVVSDSCDGVNCLNGGVCNNGTCTCPTGWTGQFCQTAVNPCDTVNCLNGGTCVNGNCDCDPGYSGVRCATVDRDKFLGVYNVSDNCVGTGYTSDIITSATGIDKIVIRDFGKYVCSGAAPDVLASVDGNNLVIPIQTFCTGNEFTISGSGTINGSQLTITINYTTEYTGNPENCTAVLTKQ